MKPKKGSKLLRKGRASIKNQHYLVTTTVLDRKPVFKQTGTAHVVLNSLHWLEKQGQIFLDAAVVMPDHLHFVAGLRQNSLSKLMHSLKSFTSNKINAQLNRKGIFWQPQYHEHAVRKDEDLIEVVFYTLNNPVRSGLVKDFRDYPHWYCRWDA